MYTAEIKFKDGTITEIENLKTIQDHHGNEFSPEEFAYFLDYPFTFISKSDDKFLSFSFSSSDVESIIIRSN
ncbi:hypothetical protein ACYSNR_03100 [Enterococcus sp. LJL128]